MDRASWPRPSAPRSLPPHTRATPPLPLHPELVAFCPLVSSSTGRLSQAATSRWPRRFARRRESGFELVRERRGVVGVAPVSGHRHRFTGQTHLVADVLPDRRHRAALAAAPRVPGSTRPTHRPYGVGEQRRGARWL